jgi:hypothetical protein
MEKQMLKSILSFGIDHIDFKNIYFRIENSPVIPLEGEGIRFNWEDFLEDKELAERLEEFYNNEWFMVHISSREFTKDEVITHITLLEESSYKELYRKIKVQLTN